MPLNPEAIDYTNLYSPNSAIKTSSGSSIDEKVGITRAFNAIMKNLPPEILSSFEKWYTEGYDLTDATPLNILWWCNREVRRINEGKAQSETDQEDASINSSSFSFMILETDQGEIMSDIVTSTPMLKKTPSIEHTRTEAPDNSLASPVPSLEALDLSHATPVPSYSTPGLFHATSEPSHATQDLSPSEYED